MFRTALMCVFAALLMAIPHRAQAGAIRTPDCGGFDQRPCSPVDTEFYFNSASGFACDRGLKIDLGNFFKTSDDQCVNDNRQTGPKDYSWPAWALGQQRYNIAAGEPINWITSLNAHNAYNNKDDGYLIPDQKYSMTDLLNWGVRSLELDVHWVYGQALVCHGATNHVGCATWDRLYAYAIREIGEWLDENPGEIIQIDFEDRANDAPDDVINNPIKKWLGNKVWTTTNTNYPYGNVPGTSALAFWPTPRQMAGAGKQVIITSSNTHNGNYIFPSQEGGIDDAVGAADLGACRGGAGLWYQHSSGDPRHWSRVYEGRALGDDLDFLFEPEVIQATQCGVGIISLGWLNALGDASGGYSRQGYDGRRDAMIWSWAEGEDDSHGPLALLRGSDERWVARLNNGETHQFACFLKRDVDPLHPGTILDPTTYADPDGLHWYITKASGAWPTGNNICRSETGGQYVFGAPLIAALPASRPDVWLNYSIVPIPLPSAMPAPVNFNAVAGSTTPPPPRTMQVYSNQGDAFRLETHTNSGDGNWLLVSPMSGTVGISGTPIAVSVDPTVVSRMKQGPYTASVFVFDETLGRETSIPVSLHVKAATSISILQIAPSPAAETGSAQVTAKLSYVPLKDPLDGTQVRATGSVILRELITTPEQETPLDPSTGLPGQPVTVNAVTANDVGSAIVNSTADNPGQSPPDDTVVFTLTNLTAGTHTYGAYYVGAYDGDNGYTGDSSYAPSTSVPVSVTVLYTTTAKMFVTLPQSRLGDRVTISATVIPNTKGGPAPGGSLKFRFTADNGAVQQLGTYPVVNGGATFDWFNLPEGHGTISATYSGDAAYAGAGSDLLAHTTVHGNPVLAGIRIIPQGGTILVDGTPFASGSILTWQVNDSHLISVPQATTPSAGSRYGFIAWSDGQPATHSVGVTSATIDLIATYEKEYQLTLNQPANGTVAVQPASGPGFYSAGSSVSVSASAQPGFVFSNFTGDMSGSAEPQSLVMDKPRSVGAVLVPVPAQAPQLVASVVSKTGDPTARLWTIQVSNVGPGAALDARLSSIDIAQTFGAACTRPLGLATPLPAALGAITPGAGAQVGVTFDFSSCPATARFAVTVHSAANNSYVGTTTINNQYR
jgi:Bacterial Ig-like domain (group 3)/Divergent InlB B-repeat domain